MNLKALINVLVLLTSCCLFSACVQTTDTTSSYQTSKEDQLPIVGQNISKIESQLNIRYLTGNEITSLVNGKVLVGDTLNFIEHNNYFKQEMHTDHTVVVHIIKKTHTKPHKTLDGWKWFVNDNAELCSDGKKGLHCKKIADIGGEYISIEPDGLIRALWKVENK